MSASLGIEAGSVLLILTCGGETENYLGVPSRSKGFTQTATRTAAETQKYRTRNFEERGQSEEIATINTKNHKKCYKRPDLGDSHPGRFFSWLLVPFRGNSPAILPSKSLSGRGAYTGETPLPAPEDPRQRTA